MFRPQKKYYPRSRQFLNYVKLIQFCAKINLNYSSSDVCMYPCMYVCMACMHASMYVCIMYVYVSMYVCMHACMYVCILARLHAKTSTTGPDQGDTLFSDDEALISHTEDRL